MLNRTQRVVVYIIISVYILVTRHILVSLEGELNYTKHKVNILYESQVILLETQAITINNYVDYTTSAEIKSRVSLLRTYLEYVSADKKFAIEEYDKKYLEIVESLRTIQSDKETSKMVTNYLIEVTVSQNEISVAKRDYSLALEKYNEAISSPFFKLTTILWGSQKKHSVYSYTKRGLDVFLFQSNNTHSFYVSNNVL